MLQRTAISTFVALGLALSPAFGLQPQEVCLPTYMGAMLGASLREVSQATASLDLLNGGENSKLRRLLEWQLVGAIAESRKSVESGPFVDSATLPSVLPNWVNAVERAEALIVVSNLENRPPMPGDSASSHPLEDLRVIKAWLSLQAAPARSNP